MSDFLRVENLGIKVGEFSLDGFSLAVGEGECVSLMGPSGCGKSTVVEAICGLRGQWLRSGTMVLNGVDITHAAAGARGIGLVPQDVVLFPSLTVREHLEFGPRLRGWKRGLIKERVENLAEGLGLESLLGRLPEGLSGGEARRVALGRAMALCPRLLCLDEALSGLDEERYEEVLAMMGQVMKEEKMTTLHVTHSRAEAEVLGDRICQMVPV